MADKNVSVQVGPGFWGLLTLIFVTLKLTGYITWSWWWVLAPMWFGAVLALVIFVIVMLVALIIGKGFK